MRGRIGAFIVICILLLSACGGERASDLPQGSTERNVRQQQDNEQELRWALLERTMADAEDSLDRKLPQKADSCRELMQGIAEDTVFRVLQVLNEDGLVIGTCIQSLEPPYEKWENTFLTMDDWVDGESCFVGQAALGGDGRVWLMLFGMTRDNEQIFYRVCRTGRDSFDTERIRGDFAGEDLWGAEVFYVDAAAQTYFAFPEGVKCYEEDFGSSVFREGGGMIWQIAEPPSLRAGRAGEDGAEAPAAEAGQPAPAARVYLCGAAEDGAFCIRSTDSTRPLFLSEEAFMDSTGRVAFADESTGYLCTTDGIREFSLESGAIQKVLSFDELGYQIDRVCAAAMGEEGTLLLTVMTEGQHILLEAVHGTEADLRARQSAPDEGRDLQEKAGEAEKEPAGAKRELELAVIYPSDFLRESVVRFNRQSAEYFIVLRECAGNEEAADFRGRIQAELLSGDGPALLSGDVLDLQNASEKGFLKDLTEGLDGCLKDMPENIRRAGVVNGACYAIPYSFAVDTYVTSADLADGRESWTSEEMLQCVGQSGAGAAINETDSAGLFALLVRGSDLIDWEAGKSFLNTEKAAQMLELAAAYGDDGSADSVGERTAEGEIMGNRLTIAGLMLPQTMEALFGGREVYIGLPSRHGDGNALVPATLSIRRACDCPEGAVAFLEFLLSADNQGRLALDAGRNGWQGFPVRSDALEQMYAYAEEAAADPDAFSEPGAAEYRGYRYVVEPLSAEGLDKVRALLENAQPQTVREQEITDMILEETPAYFSGGRSAGEVCEILQNRVQLYLDERD